MYEKLARGHATAFINGLQDFGRIEDWIEGPRRTKAMAAFYRSSVSKKPGRVLKRLAPLLRPQFQQLTICQWTRHYKAIAAKSLASTAENRVYHLPDDTKPLYSERAVFLADLLLSQHYDEITVDVLTPSVISHHAIARLVERGGVSPTTLSRDILLILEYCGTIAQKTLDTEIDHSAMMSFMLPFNAGALVAVFMEMDPAQMSEGFEGRRVLSVRTWLDSGKLSDLDIERMGGLDGLNAVMTRDYAATNERFLRWLEGNARPWQFSDSTIGDQGQGLDSR